MPEVGKDKTRDAFREGLFVRALGRPCSSNPYPPNSNERSLWESGWRLVDERDGNAPPADAMSRFKVVPEFTPGVALTKARRAPLKPKAIILPSIRSPESLRILAVIVMAIIMIILVRL
jgi:hypothetical protein